MTHKGFLFLIFPAMLVLTALEVVLSGRDLSQTFQMLEREVQAFTIAGRHPVLAWVQRGVSLLLLLATTERIVHHFAQRRLLPSPALTWTFVFYWFTTVAATAVLAANERISHEYLYPLFLGLACSLATPEDRDRILDWLRGGLLLFLLAGWAFLPVDASMVLDWNYRQGFLPGVPRFGGLATHPVMMGVLAHTTLIVLWVRPFQRRWLNACAWFIGLGALFLAQSKTAWLAFLLCAIALAMVRRAPTTVERIGDPRRSSFGVGLLLLLIAAVLAALVLFLVVDVAGMLGSFFATSEGAQLASLTGRDRIWVVALDEWAHHPVFGYGLAMWDADYREAIAMPFATHAHNQFIDTLGRSGTVGFIGLLVYFSVLAGMALRYARTTGGASLAFLITAALLSISEVPLLMIDYGTHVLTHFLLIFTVASGAAARARVRPVTLERVEPTLRTAA